MSITAAAAAPAARAKEPPRVLPAPVNGGGVEVPVGATPVPEGVPVGGTEGERVIVDSEVVGMQVVRVMTEMLGAGEVW